MSNSEYYQSLRLLATKKRQEWGIKDEKVGLRLLKKVCTSEGIKIDYWPVRGRTIRAAYFSDEDGTSILLNKNLPDAQKLFSLAHELKHHFVDRDKIINGEFKCGDYDENEVVEIGAEIFAAELIYPEAQMQKLIQELGITKENCTHISVVDFKRACPATVSYKFIVKRFQWFGIINKDEYKGIQFQKLETETYGKPFYAQAWYKSFRMRN